MTYKEMLKKYKNGQLSEPEKQKLETEIEKIESVSDYLAEQLEKDNDWITESSPADQSFEREGDPADPVALKTEETFEKYVRKSIRRSFRKLGFAVGGVLLAVLLFVQFGLSPLMSVFFYNPAERIKETVTTETDDNNYWQSYSRLETDLDVLAELTMPCKSSNSVQVSSLGYGNYSFVITPTIGYGNEMPSGIAGQIRKGNMELYTPGYFSSEYANYFIACGLDRNEDFKEALENSIVDEGDVVTITSQWYYSTLEESQEAVQELEDQKVYRVYVSFDQPKSFSETNAFLQKLEDNDCYVSQTWIGVYPEEGTLYSLIGYNYEQMQGELPVSRNEKYPELSLYESAGYSDEAYEKAQSKFKDEASMKQHLISLLRYLADQKKFNQMLDGQNIGDDWDSIADYIEENGILSYGFACVATKNEIQKIQNEDEVLGVVCKTM